MAGFHLLLAAFALVQLARYGRRALLFVRSLSPGQRALRRGNVAPFVIALCSLLILVTALRMVLQGTAR